MLNEAGDEIEGTWVITGRWQGAFLMVRRKRDAVPNTVKVSAQIDGDI
ncbi:hypothetical protein HW537_05795 [Asaia siamensis]